MAEITLNDFIAYLRQHKDVCVTYQASSPLNHEATFRYQLNDRGALFEVYTCSKSVYGLCNINDGQAMADHFLLSLRNAVKLQPTSSEDKTRFNGAL